MAAKRPFFDEFFTNTIIWFVFLFLCFLAMPGGAVTPVGDPPNVIVASNAYVIKSVSIKYIHIIHNNYPISINVNNTHCFCLLLYRVSIS